MNIHGVMLSQMPTVPQQSHPACSEGGLWDTNRVVEPICSCRSVIDRTGAQCVPLTAAGNIGGQMVVPPRTFFNLVSPPTVLFIYFLIH